MKIDSNSQMFIGTRMHKKQCSAGKRLKERNYATKQEAVKLK